MEKPIKLFEGKTLSEFVGLKNCLTFVTLKNSSEFTPSGANEKGSVPIVKNTGRINITSDRYMNMIELFKPDFFTTLADGDTYEGCPKRRVAKAGDKSEIMMEECVERRKSSKALQDLFMIASVEGGFNEFERTKAVNHLKKFEDTIDGYFIDGVHRNGAEATTLNFESLKQIVQHTNSALPNDKMKMMLGPFLPHVTMKLISLGIDVFDSSFVNLVTNCNRAISFNFNLNNSAKRSQPEINLKDVSFKDDFSPLVDDCQCFTCTKHTRAYVNHLLNTRELVGPALLTVHNLHYYMKFFEAIRASIKNDSLPDLIQLVSSQYEASIETLTYEVEEPLKEKENKESI